MAADSRASREACAAKAGDGAIAPGGAPETITSSERVPVGVQEPRGRDALAMLRLTGRARFDLLRQADACRRAHFGNRVYLCSIVAARRGGCAEDCAFCAQSARYASGVRPEPMMAPAAVLRAAQQAEQHGASHFGIVASGRFLAEEEFRTALAAIEAVAKHTRLIPCASLGRLSDQRARALVEAGCGRYNHNLETSERFFGRLCTTHRYADRLATLACARSAGLPVCCGGIIGVGERDEDRVALAFALRDLAPEVIPINVLVPIPGTPLADVPPLEPMAVLATVAMVRLVNPRAIIKLAGGRERALGHWQRWMFLAGANALIVGNYLTTAGQPVADDLAMIRDLHLRVVGPDASRRSEGDDARRV